jgi:hypothetical protein
MSKLNNEKRVLFDEIKMLKKYRNQLCEQNRVDQLKLITIKEQILLANKLIQDNIDYLLEIFAENNCDINSYFITSEYLSNCQKLYKSQVISKNNNIKQLENLDKSFSMLDKVDLKLEKLNVKANLNKLWISEYIQEKGKN